MAARSIQSSLASCALLAIAAAALAASPVERGPARSPITVTPVKTTRLVSSAVFMRSRAVVGNIAKQPSSVHAVDLEDARPYGEAPRRAVELARFDSVPVRSPNGWESVSIPLSLAFDADTGAFVCAFTDARPEWARSPLDPGAIEARVVKAGWTTEPCRGPLTATLVEILEAAWNHFGVDPAKAGQIVIRPRSVAHPDPADVWIVEILGTVVGEEQDDNGNRRALTTLVAQFRDGDREALLSIMLP